MSKSRLLSGKQKKKTGAELDGDRYQFLDVANSEPDLGLPAVNDSVLIGDTDGSRTWADIASYADQFKGYTGSQGIQGASGSAGAAGVGGFTGSQGAAGFTGSRGVGFTGSQGATGAAGVEGFNGSEGYTGSTGSTGFTGSQGIEGPAGTSGTGGTAGATGFTGSQGVTGFTGSSGVGFTGSQGVPGGITLTVTSPNGGIYIVDGINNPVLNFIRGNRYVININATNHPFYFQTSGLTYNAGLTYTNGVTGSGTQVGTIIFEVPYNAPNTLTYVCGYHANMGNTINISDLGPTGFTGSAGGGGGGTTVLERHYRRMGVLTAEPGYEKWYIPVGSVITSMLARVEVAPVGTGGGISLAVRVYRDVTLILSQSLVINNTQKASAIFTGSLAVSNLDYVVVDVINIGTVTAGENLTVTFTYTRT